MLLCHYVGDAWEWFGVFSEYVANCRCLHQRPLESSYILNNTITSKTSKIKIKIKAKLIHVTGL